MLALISITIYFILNLLVTISNQLIVLRTQCPYLLTALHAVASYISTLLVARLQNVQLNAGRTNSHRMKVVGFACLFTVNIALSNRALGLVSLSIHQIIRATAPVLTVLLTILLELRTSSSYSTSTFLSLVPIVLGVMLATYSRGTGASLHGTLITFLGAVTAVLKTIATHALQIDYDITGLELIHTTSPIAVFQASLLALWYGDLNRVGSLYSHSTASVDKAIAVMWLVMAVLLNTILAALLNLSSFEANRRCGPLSMGVAANLKQIVILLLPYANPHGHPRAQVVLGGLMTIAGGIWYAYLQGHEKTVSSTQDQSRNGIGQRRRRAQSLV